MALTNCPLIVVKKQFFEDFAEGRKTVEYRRHRRPFTVATFAPGRWVRLAYNYDPARSPSLFARVSRFDVVAAQHLRLSVPALWQVYPDLAPDTEIAMIALGQFQPALPSQ